MLSITFLGAFLLFASQRGPTFKVGLPLVLEEHFSSPGVEVTLSSLYLDVITVIFCVFYFSNLRSIVL